MQSMLGGEPMLHLPDPPVPIVIQQLDLQQQSVGQLLKAAVSGYGLLADGTLTAITLIAGHVQIKTVINRAASSVKKQCQYPQLLINATKTGFCKRSRRIWCLLIWVASSRAQAA